MAVALFIYLSRDLDRMIGAATAEAQVLGAMMMQSLVVLLTITSVIAVTIAAIDLVWQRFEHSPAAADVVPGPARGDQASPTATRT